MSEDERPGNATLQRGVDSEEDTGTEPVGLGWHSRGYLPHFESTDKLQHVTYHLADSLPKGVVERLEAELKRLSPEKQDAERRKRVEAWIDAGHGCCVLREPAIASLVQNSFLRFDGERYRLLAWVVMPNHVHVLFQPLNGWLVAKIVASWKSYTGRRISEWLKAAGNAVPGGIERIWHREYWDRYIRDEKHYRQAVTYIHRNPVKAGLVAEPEAWQWSSAYTGSAGL